MFVFLWHLVCLQKKILILSVAPEVSKMFLGDNQLSLAEQLLQLMKSANIQPGAFTYLVLLNRCGSPAKSFALLQEYLQLPKQDTKLYDFKVCVRVLGVCVRGGDWDLALEVLRQMVGRGVPRGDNMIGEIAKAFSPCDVTVLEQAMELAAQMRLADKKVQHKFSLRLIN